MENVSKALTIAGAMLIAILIASAVIFMYRDLTSFQREKENAEVIEDVARFNKSYESYQKELTRNAIIVACT